MSTTGEKTMYYCKRYGFFCIGANEWGECNTTACWNNNTVRIVIEGETVKHAKMTDYIKRDVSPVRHGMWVDVDRMQMYDLHGVLTWGNSFMCTECNFKTFAVEGHMSQYHYCPNCGARMDGGDDEID